MLKLDQNNGVLFIGTVTNSLNGAGLALSKAYFRALETQIYIYQINVLPDLLFLVFQTQQGFNSSMSHSKVFLLSVSLAPMISYALLLLDERALIISTLYCLISILFIHHYTDCTDFSVYLCF